MIRTLTILAAAAFLAACNRSDDAGTPLGESRPTITGEAKVALDSANLLFRARAYDQALVQYQRTAQLVPNDVTPLLGVMMVAEATGNAELRERTMTQIRRLNPDVDTSGVSGHSQLIDIHKAPPEGHP